MTQKELKTLKRGDIVVHKKSSEKFTVIGLVPIWDGFPPNLTNKRMTVCCEDLKYGNRYFEAKEIRKEV